MADNGLESGSIDTVRNVAVTSSSRKYAGVAVLLLVNLLNYMDRYTIAGVLPRLQAYFSINDQQAGLLQTVFIVFYMVFAPITGYFGDRYNRKAIIFCGVMFWIIAVLSSTFVRSEHFYEFLFIRGLVGIGEASYSTVAPTIIADTFTGSARSTMLMIFYFAVPVGSGLGYIGSSRIAVWTNSWQGGVRFTPLLGLACLICIAYFLDEPARGQAEHAELHSSTLKDDLRYLAKVPTFLLTSAGFTCVVFGVGALSWWTPALFQQAYIVHDVTDEGTLANVSLVFGLITCLSGVVGVIAGSTLAQSWRNGKCGFIATKCADSYVCAIGSLSAVPFLFTCLWTTADSINVAWVLLFFAITLMCLNWAVNMDILMAVIVANRRATATAIQTLMAHLFGDASSPYIVGAISDAIRGDNISSRARFQALQYALFMPTFLVVLSGGFYLWSTFYVSSDIREAQFAQHIYPSDETEDTDVQTLVSNVRRDSSESSEEQA